MEKHGVFVNLQVDLPKREIDHVFPSYGGGGPLTRSTGTYILKYLYAKRKSPCHVEILMQELEGGRLD